MCRKKKESGTVRAHVSDKKEKPRIKITQTHLHEIRSTAATTNAPMGAGDVLPGYLRENFLFAFVTLLLASSFFYF
jgi:hypothetical protein